MSLVLDPATETRIQQELARGPFTAPAELLNRALDSLEAERIRYAEFRAEMLADIEEGLAQLDRGESISGEDLRKDLERRKASYAQSLLAHS